jgi:hypothetical protein
MATREDPPRLPAVDSADRAEPSAEMWAGQFQEALQEQHVRVRRFLEAHRQRWREAETQLCRQIEDLEGERSLLRATCDQLRGELAQRQAVGSPDGPSADGSAGSQQEAEKEIDDLKHRNSEYQRQLSALRAKAPRGEEIHDWESEKRRILAALDSDLGDGPLEPAERLEIEEMVRRTDLIMAEQAREIERLQHLLKTQSNTLGSVAVGAAPLEQVLDHDALIREERERLRQLQAECQEKLRRAEIELSLERATIARRQAEVEERLRLFETRVKDDETTSDALCPTGHPVRGRWLAHLGLMESDQPRLPTRKEGDRPRQK